MDTSPEKNIKVAPHYFDGRNFVSDPILKLRGWL
jgi:hypothetical protein